jgi:hypothetical protein
MEQRGGGGGREGGRKRAALAPLVHLRASFPAAAACCGRRRLLALLAALPCFLCPPRGCIPRRAPATAARPLRRTPAPAAPQQALPLHTVTRHCPSRAPQRALPAVPEFALPVVDVRDAAAAHLAALCRWAESVAAAHGSAAHGSAASGGRLASLAAGRRAAVPCRAVPCRPSAALPQHLLTPGPANAHPPARPGSHAACPPPRLHLCDRRRSVTAPPLLQRARAGQPLRVLAPHAVVHRPG